MDAKSLHIRFDRVDGIIKIYNGIKHLELSNSYNDNFYRIVSRKYNSIFNRILKVKKVELQILLTVILQGGRIRIN